MIILTRILLAALLGLNAGAAFAEVYLPDFTLNAKKASDVKRWPRSFDFPTPVPTNMGIYFYGDGRGPVPARIPCKGDHVQTTSSISIRVEGKKGKAEIAFPKVEFEEQGTGNKASFFIRISSETPAPVLSWAAIICSGRNYIGYKGASLKLPEKSGTFFLDDTTLALGRLGALVRKTHPWLIAGLDGKGGRSLDPLCSADFTARMKGYNVETLPSELDGFNFGYDAGRNILKITWRDGK